MTKNQTCPTCGRPIANPMHKTIDSVLALMNAGKELYKSRDGDWFLTYSGGQVHSFVVAQLVEGGYVRDRYSDLPGQYYTTGRTIDATATRANRKAGKKGIVYLEEPKT